MTKDEVNAKTKEKVDKVNALLKELQLTVSAEEVVTETGLIRKVVYYMDNESYPVDEEKNG